MVGWNVRKRAFDESRKRKHRDSVYPPSAGLDWEEEKQERAPCRTTGLLQDAGELMAVFHFCRGLSLQKRSLRHHSAAASPSYGVVSCGRRQPRALAQFDGRRGCCSYSPAGGGAGAPVRSMAARGRERCGKEGSACPGKLPYFDCTPQGQVTQLQRIRVGTKNKEYGSYLRVSKPRSADVHNAVPTRCRRFSLASRLPIWTRHLLERAACVRM